MPEMRTRRERTHAAWIADEPYADRERFGRWRETAALATVARMPIAKHGFLGKEIETVREQIRGEYPELFAMCREINDYAYSELLELQPPVNDGQRVTAAALMVKVMNDCQAAIILLEHGLVLQAEETLRPALEASFRLVLLCQDPSYLQEFAAGDNFDVKRSLHGATKLSPERQRALKDVMKIVQERLARARGTIKDEDLSEVGAEEIAKRAGLSDLYNSFYRLLCLSTHAAPRALQRYIAVDAAGDPNGFHWGPETADIVQSLCICGIAYLTTWAALAKIFPLKNPDKITDLDRRFGKLIESTASL